MLDLHRAVTPSSVEVETDRFVVFHCVTIASVVGYNLHDDGAVGAEDGHAWGDRTIRSCPVGDDHVVPFETRVDDDRTSSADLLADLLVLSEFVESDQGGGLDQMLGVVYSKVDPLAEVSRYVPARTGNGENPSWKQDQGSYSTSAAANHFCHRFVVCRSGTGGCVVFRGGEFWVS